MTVKRVLRRAFVPFCLSMVLLSGCGRDDAVTSRQTPTAIPGPATSPGTASTPYATGPAGPGRSVLAAPGAPRPDGGRTRVPGAPQPEKSTKRKVPVAPIRIPARVQDEGRNFADVLGEIRAGIRDQCGGTLCVTPEARYETGGDQRCEFVFLRTEPAQRSMVKRDSTVAVIGVRPDSCVSTLESSSSSSSPSPETEDESASP